MQVFKPFAQENPQELYQLIKDYPFATLITQSDTGVEVDHIPFVLAQKEGGYCLQGHIAKANPLWKNVGEASSVMVVFQGPHAYISPQYYPTKQLHGKAVPTWNYAVVHVRGAIQYQHDGEWNKTMLAVLSAQQEVTQQPPWTLEDAPKEYIDKMVKAIVGIEIAIESITGQWKLSQNQPLENREGVVRGLQQTSYCRDHEMAQWVERYAVSTQ